MRILYRNEVINVAGATAHISYNNNQLEIILTNTSDNLLVTGTGFFNKPLTFTGQGDIYWKSSFFNLPSKHDLSANDFEQGVSMQVIADPNAAVHYLITRN